MHLGELKQIIENVNEKWKITSNIKKKKKNKYTKTFKL